MGLNKVMTRLMLCLAMIAFVGEARAGRWFDYEDVVVMQRSDLIVVGHLRKDSIQYYKKEVNDSEKSKIFEFKAVLEISQYLKGWSLSNTIPIILHYGLVPLEDGRFERDGFLLNRRMPGEDYPKGKIEILAWGTSMSLSPLVEDAAKDNIWFLRRGEWEWGVKLGGDTYGIFDREDLQPLKLLGYFRAYYDRAREAKLAACAEQIPELAERVKRYFDHMEVQRILKIKDLGKRCDKLLPFFLKRTWWNGTQWEARDGLFTCGKPGGERLKKAFDDPAYAELRPEIIRVWRETGYTEVVPMLMELLKKHNAYWATQKMGRRWNEATQRQTEEGKRWIAVISESSMIVYALRKLCANDLRPKELYEQTRELWRRLDALNDHPKMSGRAVVLEESEDALRELEELKKKPLQLNIR